MAIQTSDGISTPEQGDAFDYAGQLATLAGTTQLALNKRANSFIGTSAEREAVRTVLAEGSHWTDTNGDKAFYILQGEQWKRVWPEEKGPRITSGWLKMNSGWKIDTGGTNHINRRGEWAYLHLRFRRNGATITTPNSGNIPNYTIAQVKEEWRPSTVQPLSGGNAWGRMGGFTINANGEIRLNSVGGTTNITNNQAFQVRGWYMPDF